MIQAAQDEPRSEADVVVVGAGLAGLVATRELVDQGLTVRLLEARHRVGGRLMGYDLGNGRVADLGGEYFGDKSTAIAEVARSVGVEGFRTWDEGKRVTILDGRRFEYTGLFPWRMGPRTIADFGQAVLRIERLARTVPPDAPWTAESVDDLDSQTFWSWMQRNMVTDSARAFMTMIVEAAYCAHPSDLSLLHVLYYANASGGFRYLMEISGGIQRYRFEGGAHSIPIKLAAGLTPQLRLGAPVRRIELLPDSVRVHGDGFAVSARYAVIAVPISLAGRFVYDPPMPPQRDQLAQRLPPGSAIKCLAIYDEPFWRSEGFSGQVTDNSGPFRVAFDTSPADGSPGVLSAFVTGTAARKLCVLPAAQRRAAVLAGLAEAHGQRAGQPVDFVEQNWLEEPYTRGCYHGHASPGVYRAFGPALRRPVGRVHWAGTETGVHQMGSMGGAVDSGRRAAREIVARWHGERSGHLGGDPDAGRSSRRTAVERAEGELRA